MGVEAEGVVSPVSAGCAADVVTTSCLTLRLTNQISVFRSRDQCYPITFQYTDHVISIDQSEVSIHLGTAGAGPLTRAAGAVIRALLLAAIITRVPEAARLDQAVVLSTL